MYHNIVVRSYVVLIDKIHVTSQYYCYNNISGEISQVRFEKVTLERSKDYFLGIIVSKIYKQNQLDMKKGKKKRKKTNNEKHIIVCKCDKINIIRCKDD